MYLESFWGCLVFTLAVGFVVLTAVLAAGACAALCRRACARGPRRSLPYHYAAAAAAGTYLHNAASSDSNKSGSDQGIIRSLFKTGREWLGGRGKTGEHQGGTVFHRKSSSSGDLRSLDGSAPSGAGGNEAFYASTSATSSTPAGSRLAPPDSKQHPSSSTISPPTSPTASTSPAPRFPSFSPAYANASSAAADSESSPSSFSATSYSPSKDHPSSSSSPSTQSFFLARLWSLACRLVRGEQAIWRHWGFWVALDLLLLLFLSLFASFPAYIRSYQKLWPAGHLRHEVAFSRTLHHEFPDFTIVTFSSDGYTDPLENMIGSIHVWAQGVPVVVYDLGLSPSHRRRIAAIENVQVVLFNFSHYPHHVQFMNNYAFKPLLLYDAVQRFGNILSLDAGIEVRSSLWPVFDHIRTTGYFFVEASDVDPLSRVHPSTVAWLNMSAPSRKELQCYAGMHGYRADSIAVHKVLAPTARCALNPRCIDPKGSGHENHRYEQAVFSLHIRQLRLHCNIGRMYNEHLPTTLHPDPLAPHQSQIFFFRRWRYPKPYAPYVTRIGDDGLRYRGGYVQGGASAARAGGAAEAAADNSSIFENGVTDRKNSDNELLQCLRDHDYVLESCHNEQMAWESAAAKKPLLGSPHMRQREELRGFFLGLAATVFWSWPVSIGVAAYVCVAALLLAWLSRFSGSRHVPMTAAALVFVFIVAGHIGTPQMCRELGKVSFAVGSVRAAGDSFASYLEYTECQGSNSVISFSAPPLFFSNPSTHARYAYFESEEYGVGLVHYAIPSVLLPSSSSQSSEVAVQPISNDVRKENLFGWVYMGVALMEPFPVERPCFFSEGEQAFMLPVTRTLSRIILYTTIALPKGWHVVRDLVQATPKPGAMVPMLYRPQEDQPFWYLTVTFENGDVFTYRAHSLLSGVFLPAHDAATLFSPASAVCR